MYTNLEKNKWLPAKKRGMESFKILISYLTTPYSMKSVIKKDGLNFVSLYFKIRTSDKYDANYIWLEVECWNEDKTHAAQQSPTQF
jgi:hypothetical protein